MPSLISGYAYDIFISYRQKDNKYDGWVTEFVQNLQKELEATFKEDISIYFDENPHDGLLETHDVDDSLKKKLKCLIFIPILSRTYCDPNCFAWQNEFRVFNQMASADALGPVVSLRNGNITGRVLPIRIHELDPDDVRLVEDELKRKLRPVDFIYKAPGVNRPLRSREDNPKDNLEKTYYRDQINKVANSISEIIGTLKREQSTVLTAGISRDDAKAVLTDTSSESKGFVVELSRRNIPRAAFAYILFSIVAVQVTLIVKYLVGLPDILPSAFGLVLLGLFPVALVLAWYYEVSPQGLVRIGSVQSVTNPYAAAKKKPLTGNVIMLVLVILLIVQNVYISSLQKVHGDASLPPQKSIAVVPFENRGGALNEYFSDGLTEDINAHLSKINALHVITASALRSYKGTQESYSSIAAELGVSYILIGSIQQIGDQLRIAPQLIDAKTNEYVWGDVFNLNPGDLFLVQSEIAQRIAGVLKIKLSDGELELLNKHPTENLTAYDHYLQGRSHYIKYNADENDVAIQHFKMAIAVDPGYALAWAGLGDAYNQRFGRFAKGNEWRDSAVYASKRAIELDPNLSEGYKSLASAYYYLTRYDESKELMEKAVQLDPNNIAAIGNLGLSYFMEGDLAEAMRYEKRSAALNPRNYIPYQIMGWIYRLLGDYSNAELWLKKSLELQPVYDTYELLAYTYVCQGRKKEALDIIPLLLQLDEEDPFVIETAGFIANFAGNPSLAQTYFQANREKNAIVNRDAQFSGNIHLGQILLKQDNNIVDAEILLSNAFELNMAEINSGSLDIAFPFNIAGIYAIRGKPDEAIKWIDKAIELNWMDYVQLTHGPWFTDMRNNPELLKRVDMLKQKMEQQRLQASAL